MRKLFTLIIVMLIIIAGCSRNANITIIAKELNGLKECSPVFYKSLKIGEVKGIDIKEEFYNINVAIDRTYKDTLNHTAEFYLLNKGDSAYIEAMNLQETGTPLGNNIIKTGKSHWDYKWDRSKRYLQEKKKEISSKIEWDQLIEQIDNKLNKFKEKAAELKKDEMPYIKEGMEHYLDSLTDEYGQEIRKVIEEYRDSLNL